MEYFKDSLNLTEGKNYVLYVRTKEFSGRNYIIKKVRKKLLKCYKYHALFQDIKGIRQCYTYHELVNLLVKNKETYDLYEGEKVE